MEKGHIINESKTGHYYSEINPNDYTDKYL